MYSEHSFSEGYLLFRAECRYYLGGRGNSRAYNFRELIKFGVHSSLLTCSLCCFEALSQVVATSGIRSSKKRDQFRYERSEKSIKNNFWVFRIFFLFVDCFCTSFQSLKTSLKSFCPILYYKIGRVTMIKKKYFMMEKKWKSRKNPCSLRSQVGFFLEKSRQTQRRNKGVLPLAIQSWIFQRSFEQRQQ